MESFDKFEQALHDSLMQLHNPLYQPPALLCHVLDYPPQTGNKTLQAAIIQAIEDLKPTADMSHQARSWRLYDVLAYRYIQGLTQEATAKQMGLTPRHLRREQGRAVHGLAQRLWTQKQADQQIDQDQTATSSSTEPAEATQTDQVLPAATVSSGDNLPSLENKEGKKDNEPESDPWRSQVRRELAALQQNTPEAKSAVTDIITGVIKVGQVLTAKHNTVLTVAPIPHNLTAMIHPSALRQILLTAIEKLVKHTPSGKITLQAEKVEDKIMITVTGGPIITEALPDSALIEELLNSQGSTLNIERLDDYIVFQIGLTSDRDTVSVLVVDDNADLATFYQLYVTNTRYRITHLADGKRLFETTATLKPDIIVLDVLLPGMDGWELLTYLHEHPDTRSIPIIICSVIRREELALALGASLCLAKPVRRQAFIQALDQVSHLIAPTNSPPRANNAATC